MSNFYFSNFVWGIYCTTHNQSIYSHQHCKISKMITGTGGEGVVDTGVVTTISLPCAETKKLTNNLRLFYLKKNPALNKAGKMQNKSRNMWIFHIIIFRNVCKKKTEISIKRINLPSKSQISLQKQNFLGIRSCMAVMSACISNKECSMGIPINLKNYTTTL